MAFSISFYPYLFWTDMLFNIGTVFGFSPYILAVTLSLFLVFLSAYRTVLRQKDLVILIVYFSLMITVVLIRNLTYYEAISFSKYRTVFMVFIYFTSLFYILQNEYSQRKISSIIIFNVVVQAIFGIVHHNFFPYVVTGMALDDTGAGMYILDPGEGGYRENGTLIGSNLFGNFLVLGIFLILSRLKPRRLKGNFLLFLSLVVTIWAIHLSGSRYALVSSLVISMFYMLRIIPLQYFYLPIVSGLTFLMFTPILEGVLQRTNSGGSGGRIEKTVMAIDMLSESLTTFLFGVPTKIVTTTKTSDGLLFSDNSFMLSLLNYGVVAGMLFFIVLLYFILKRVYIGMHTFVFLSYIIGTFLFNNAILWDIWLLYAIATLFIISDKKIIFKRYN